MDKTDNIQRRNRSVKAALLGLGTVGMGVYRVLRMQEDEMEDKLGSRVELKYILIRNREKAAKNAAFERE